MNVPKQTNHLTRPTPGPLQPAATTKLRSSANNATNNVANPRRRAETTPAQPAHPAHPTHPAVRQLTTVNLLYKPAHK